MMEGSAAAQIEPADGRSIRAVMRLLRDELTLTPDRWARMLRMTALVTVVVVVSNPFGLLCVSDLALGRRPEELFRKGISARLAAAGAFLAGAPGDGGAARRAFERLERMGTGDISSYTQAGPAAAAGTRTLLLAQVDLLLLLLRELPPDAKNVPALAQALVAAGEACRAASDALLAEGPVLQDGLTKWERELAGRADLPAGVLAVVLPPLTCVRDIGSCLLELRDSPSWP